MSLVVLLRSGPIKDAEYAWSTSPAINDKRLIGMDVAPRTTIPYGVLHYTVHRVAAVEAALRVSLANRRYILSSNVSPIGTPESLTTSLDRIAHREAVQCRAHLEHFARHKHE
jgi:hypothetical protein